MIINFVTPPLKRKKFSGGLYCIMKYAQGLIERGHTVNIVTPPGSKQPQWIHFDGNIIEAKAPKLQFSRPSKLLLSIAKKIIYAQYNLLDDQMQRALNREIFNDVMPTADITIGSTWQSSYIVDQFGTGEKCYFSQHYEPYFSDDFIDQKLAAASYHLSLHKIANSSWLKTLLSEEIPNQTIYQSTNAVDLDKFYIDKPKRSKGKSVNVISYGGRNVIWKGFEEMALAIKLARESLPDWKINWNVYGSAALPPNNKIATYNALGFLQPDALRRAYNDNDILLSASWYESFPLFPIEAMACGVAVISTQKGTEDYAKNDFNAIIVQERNISSIADGLIKLINDGMLRDTIVKCGLATAAEFNWNEAISRMENCLSNIALQKPKKS